MRGRAYLDWNATAPLRPEARAAVMAALDLVGNPSSVHAEGRAAKALVESARADVAALVGCQPGEVVFTSGATEAAGVLAGTGSGISVDPTAHDCLWVHARDGEGAGIRAMGLANSETGVITEPSGEARLLIDVVQAVGRIPFAFSWSGADFALVSAHKIGGPKGVGALILRDGVQIAPLRAGGGQEQGRRSGTENIPGIAGFGAAAKAALRDLDAGRWEEVSALRDQLEARILDTAPDAVIVGRDLPRLPNTSSIMVAGWKGETQVMQMDLAGFAISAGSACSSGKVKASRVLKAMGYDEVSAASAIRVSIGPETRAEDLDAFAAAWAAQYQKFRAKAA